MVSVRGVALAVVITGLAGGGCTAARVRELRLAPTGLTPRDSIAVILLSHLEDEKLAELEGRMTGCIRDALGRIHSDLRIIPTAEFRKLAFSDLNAEKIPTGELLRQALYLERTYHERITPLGLRYLIAVSAEETSRLTAFEGGTGNSLMGGPLALWTWDKAALMEATVVDTGNHRVAGFVQAYSSGKAEAGFRLITIPFPVPIPYGMTSFPSSAACRGLGDGVAKFLAGESPVQGQPGTAKPRVQPMD